MPTQSAWLRDNWHLKIWEKSRQVGATLTDALHTVLIVSVAGARFDVWVSSRDEMQSNLYGEDVRGTFHAPKPSTASNSSSTSNSR